VRGRVALLSFTAPGDNGPCGTPATYLARLNGKPIHLPLGPPLHAGAHVERQISLPAGSRALTLAARDAAGNTGPPAIVVVR
jgi:hypothetical protein